MGLTNYLDDTTMMFRVFVDGIASMASVAWDNTVEDIDILMRARRDADNTDCGYSPTGDIAEILSFDLALEEYERQAVQAYLMTKYGR